MTLKEEMTMKKSRTVRFGLSGMIAGAMMFSAVSAMPAVTNAQEPDANGYYYHDTFENGTDDWEGRGGASVSTGGTA